MTRQTVGIVGASGATGSSILKALLEAGGFDIITFSRPSSLKKPANLALKDAGVQLRAMDLPNSSPDDLTTNLKGVDILISAVGARAQLDQIPLATAAKTAGVKLIVPCAFITVMPVGVQDLRDQKEQVYNHIKRLGLPYTIIDVGWWYQIAFSRLPSGKLDYAVAFDQPMAGDGNQLSAITDLRDVGRYVARVIVDVRTVNQYVLVYNEVWSQSQICDKLEELSGEKLDRRFVSKAEYEERIAEGRKTVEKDPENAMAWLQITYSQYLLSWGIHGHNTPEYAKYLGYQRSKELYPDFEYVKFEDFLRDLLADDAENDSQTHIKAVMKGLMEK